LQPTKVLCIVRREQKSVKSLLRGYRQPVFAFRKHSIEKAASFFLNNFKGEPLYAVKTNPEPHVIKILCQLGFHSFDVASLEEIRLVSSLSKDANLYYMHPVKPRHAIREAYFKYGVRHFSLDSKEELDKIRKETKNADDLCLHVRMSIPNTFAELSLGEKFGVNLQDAPKLLSQVRQYAKKLGVCFHVGSQCMHPDAYRIAIRMAISSIKEAKVTIESLNVGGGFPSIYPGMVPPPMSSYFDAIHEEFRKVKGYKKLELLCEPGRAIVAESTSVIVRVEMRKGQNLYINDGTYGSLFDAGIPHFIYPVNLLRGKDDKGDSDHVLPFSFYGPTCDTLDFMKGPFYLPSDVREGDFIEIGQIGAYGRTMATGFNGFSHKRGVHEVDDNPLMTMYGDDKDINHSPEKIAV